MIIPKGRKFSFSAVTGGQTTFNAANLFSNLGFITSHASSYAEVMTGYYKDQISSGVSEKKALDQASSILTNDLLEGVFGTKSLSYISIPSPGYTGNAYINSDISLTVNNNFISPLEGLLDGVPTILDVAMRAVSGTSIKSNRLSSMKYWTNTNPMSQEITFVFETQVDSFYDVYLPTMMLLWLASPGEASGGFYTPPIPTLRLIAKEAAKVIQQVSDNFRVEKTESSGVIISVAATLDKALQTFAGFSKSLANGIQDSGYITTLNVGNNFRFENIYIKEVTTAFSTELAYAPLYFLCKKSKKMSPYSMGLVPSKALSQTLGAAIATGNNLVQGVTSILSKFPGVLEDGKLKVSDLPAFPVRSEVTVSFDLPFPLTKNGSASVANVFRDTSTKYRY